MAAQFDATIGKIEQQVAQLEAQVADLHIRAQELNKVAGCEAQAAATYRELAALDDRALTLRLAAATPADGAAVAAAAAASPAHHSPLPPPLGWASVQQRQRAIDAVLGAAVGDAAACPCQWVYSLDEMASLAAGRPQLEFYDPPQCPFFEYPVGSASPYFEQTAVLLQSLAKEGSMHSVRYAAKLFAAFGPGFAGYRDRSSKNFLRRYAAGAVPPLTGSADDQANCFARLPPLVALYAGAQRSVLLAAVERMVRVTQNDAVAVAYGTAAALILEGVVQGSSVAAALLDTIQWLQQQQDGQQGQQKQQQGQQGQQQEQQQAAAVDADVLAVSSALWGQVASRLLEAAELAPMPPLEAAVQLGRNCHLPNSLQTPLQVLLHLEWRQGQQQGQAGAEEQPGATAGVKALPAPAIQGQRSRRAAAAAASSGGSADADLCLPCSMGACPLPRSLEQAAAAGSRVLAAILDQQQLQQQQQQQRAAPPAGVFEEAVRLAIRPGGCCASRAGFVGALAGALGAQLPADWAAKVLGYGELEQQAEQLARLRD